MYNLSGGNIWQNLNSPLYLYSFGGQEVYLF